MLIVIEGIDGSGKTTVAAFLEQELTERGFEVVRLEEPSDSKYGRKLEQLSHTQRLTPKKEFKYFLQDRKIDIQENILPALKEEKIVIMDRYYHSHVYQAARGMEIDEMMAKNKKIAPKPDLVIILDLPVKKALKRIEKKRKAHDKFESDPQYLEQVRELYLKFSDNENVRIIDAQKDLDTVESKVLKEVLSHIRLND